MLHPALHFLKLPAVFMLNLNAIFIPKTCNINKSIVVEP